MYRFRVTIFNTMTSDTYTNILKNMSKVHQKHTKLFQIIISLYIFHFFYLTLYLDDVWVSDSHAFSQWMSPLRAVVD